MLLSLGIDPNTPIELLFVSKRSRLLFSEKQVTNLAEALDVIRSNEYEGLCRYNNVGRRTACELTGILKAVVNMDHVAVRKYLPLENGGCSISLPAWLRLVMEGFNREDIIALYEIFALGQTLRVASLPTERTTSGVLAVVQRLTNRIAEVFNHFPVERQMLWEAWKCGEIIQSRSLGDLGHEAREIVSGAINKVFGDSAEGIAFLESRGKMFKQWYEIMSGCPEYYLEGIDVKEFVQIMNMPSMLTAYLSYLEKSPYVAIDRISGKVCPKYRPLALRVKAALALGGVPMSVYVLHERLRKLEDCKDLQIKHLKRTVTRWEFSLVIPRGHIFWKRHKGGPRRRGSSSCDAVSPS
jgi:hypothetical protein